MINFFHLFKAYFVNLLQGPSRLIMHVEENSHDLLKNIIFFFCKKKSTKEYKVEGDEVDDHMDCGQNYSTPPGGMGVV